ncbi:MAG: cell envelope integrity EipB family protein [Rhodospirillales bacterium]
MTNPRIAAVSIAALGVLAALPAAAQLAPRIEVAPHRAVYQMTLASAKSGSGVVSASGALAFEWGDSCDGWTVEQRYKLTLVFAQPGEVEIVTNYATWESKDGLAYRFNVRKSRNGKPGDDVSGKARLDGPGGTGKAEFTLPEKMAKDLPAGTVFPTEHTLVLLKQALADKTVVRRVVFDGATADGAAEVNALIGRKLGVGQAGAEPHMDRPGWYMRMAYFNLEKKAGGEPDYEIGLELQDNGIARAIKLDYADFSIKGTLEKVELLPKPAC